MTDRLHIDRLFVPVTSEVFGWWASGRKTWELRRAAPRWSPTHVYDGRSVEIRRGYSGDSLWGRIVGDPVRLDVGLRTGMLHLSDILPEPLVSEDPKLQSLLKVRYLQRVIGATSGKELSMSIAFRVQLTGKE